MMRSVILLISTLRHGIASRQSIQALVGGLADKFEQEAKLAEASAHMEKPEQPKAESELHQKLAEMVAQESSTTSSADSTDQGMNVKEMAPAGLAVLGVVGAIGYYVSG